jgi:hypothetical protein
LLNHSSLGLLLKYQRKNHLPHPLLFLKYPDWMEKRRIYTCFSYRAAELQELLTDNHVFAELFYSLEEVKSVRQTQNQLVEQNAAVSGMMN